MHRSFYISCWTDCTLRLIVVHHMAGQRPLEWTLRSGTETRYFTSSGFIDLSFFQNWGRSCHYVWQIPWEWWQYDCRWVCFPFTFIRILFPLISLHFGKSAFFVISTFSTFPSGFSPTSDFFSGQLRSSLKCSICSHYSTTFDIFYDISLPTPKVFLFIFLI